MKVVFLDIDGVLNCLYDIGAASDTDGDIHALDHSNWNRDSLKALGQIIDQTGAKIVISSTWRKHRREGAHEPSWWNREFSYAGLKAECVGITPGSSNGFRGREINRYLKDHPEVSQYVILDDDSDFYPEQPRVHVHQYLGLRDKHVEKAVALLEGGTFEMLDCMEEWNPPVDE